MGALADLKGEEIPSAKNGPRPGSTDRACGSEASCKMKSLIANRCSFGRDALQTTYQTFNLMAHTMGSAITVLCGCLFVNDQATCALQSVPPVCIFPYSVYSQIFASSIQLWEAVKAATRTCMVHGDAAISS